MPFPLFQFHKGAIRTCMKYHIQINGYIFQFHKGAIRTAGGTWLRSNSSNFNSIKVRLERLVVPGCVQTHQISIP